MLIIAGLFIAALNFVEMMGESHHGHHGAEATTTEAGVHHSEPAAPEAAPAAEGQYHRAGSDTTH